MYATLADMLERFEAEELVQLTLSDDAQDTRLEERVNAQLVRASTRIDGYVAVKYRTGGVSVPPLLKEIACDLARHGLYRDTPPEAAQKAFDRAIGDLKDIAKGVIKLDAGGEPLEARPGAVVTARPPRIFGRESMDGY